MEMHRLTGTIGAEITGIDLRQPISDDLRGLLRHELARHQVVFFRDQHLSLDQLKAFTQVFGPLARLPYVQPLEGEPEVIRVGWLIEEAVQGRCRPRVAFDAFAITAYKRRLVLVKPRSQAWLEFERMIGNISLT